MIDTCKFKNQANKLLSHVHLENAKNASEKSIHEIFVSDFSHRNSMELKTILHKHYRIKINTNNTENQILTRFAKKLANNIIEHQKSKIPISKLTPQHVNLAAEIVSPNHKRVNYTKFSNERKFYLHEELQRKEAFYYLDILIEMCNGLGIAPSILDLSRHGLVENKSINCGFIRQLKELSTSAMKLGYLNGNHHIQ